MEILIVLGIILVFGYFFGLIAEYLKLPRVSAYLIAGVLFSDKLLGQLFHLHIESWSDIFSKICLGFIAYIIGGEIRLYDLRKSAKSILLITLFESLTPVIIVFISFQIAAYLFNTPEILSYILASIAATTAPASTMAVIDQYRVKGQMTQMTLSIVALDDAFGIIVFAILYSFFVPLNGTSGFEILLKEIFVSMIFGILLGYFFSRFAKHTLSSDYLLPLLIGLVLICVGFSELYDFSSLLCCISLGFIANNTNIHKGSRVSLLLPIQHIKELIYIMFFTFAGVHFDPIAFIHSVNYILIYVASRAIGKYMGALVGCYISLEKNNQISKYLGFALLPQAGVAIGLVINLVQVPFIVPYKDELFNIILGSTLVYEVMGPIAAKFAFRSVRELC